MSRKRELMKIKQATIKDLPAIGNLWLEMAAEIVPDSYKPNVVWWKEIAERLMKSNVRYDIYYAVDRGMMIGFIDYMAFCEPATGKIHLTGQHFYVKPEYRKENIGKMLYLKFLKTAKRLRIEVVDLFCNPSDNQWKRIGYQPARMLMRKGI